jgi:hypothetical protein
MKERGRKKDEKKGVLGFKVHDIFVDGQSKSLFISGFFTSFASHNKL